MLVRGNKIPDYTRRTRSRQLRH